MNRWRPTLFKIPITLEFLIEIEYYKLKNQGTRILQIIAEGLLWINFEVSSRQIILNYVVLRMLKNVTVYNFCINPIVHVTNYTVMTENC